MASKLEVVFIVHLMGATWSLLVYAMTCPSSLLAISEYLGFDGIPDSPWCCKNIDEAVPKSKQWRRYVVPIGFALPTVTYIRSSLCVLFAVTVYLILSFLIGYIQRVSDRRSRSS